MHPNVLNHTDNFCNATISYEAASPVCAAPGTAEVLPPRLSHNCAAEVATLPPLPDLDQLVLYVQKEIYSLGQTVEYEHDHKGTQWLQGNKCAECLIEY